MLKKLVFFGVFLSILLAAAGGVGLLWAYNYFSRDLPRFDTIDDYKPSAVAGIFAEDGTLIAEEYDQRRYPLKLSEVPGYVKNAFLAAEDAAFYNHPGIDPISILRAFVKNVQTGTIKQGGSTITQQVVKNLLLSREKKLRRKIKEAILAYRLEQRLSKDEILEIYLNQIFFGNKAHGLKAATKIYFHKQVGELTLGEGAMLAGLPQAPSRYSPTKNFRAARKRQKYVLNQMVKAGFITAAAAKQAMAKKPKVYSQYTSSVFIAPYYVAEVLRVFKEKFKDLDIKRDGLKVYTAVDLKVYDMARRAVRKGLKEVDKRRGWRGPLEYLPDGTLEQFNKKYKNRIPDGLEPGEVYPALITAKEGNTVTVEFGEYSAVIDLKKPSWAKRKLGSDDSVVWIKSANLVRPGDVIEVSLEEDKFETLGKVHPEPGSRLTGVILDQTPELEASLVLLDPNTGKVPAIIGGYDYSRSVYNRATQARRQPGSAFKPLVYFTAIDRFSYTPSTMVYDEARSFKVGDEFWTPANYDKSFLGPITLRTALQKSRNMISADIISRIGVDVVIQTARGLGIESDLGRNLSLSLGSSEVTVLEMTRAYGVFAAKGVLFDSVFITKIEDRNGKVIYDYQREKLAQAKQAVDPNSAFIMAHMMKGVVQWGTGYRVKKLGRPVAGKTGTSNEQMDAWFVGYTPDWACGVWSGFDTKKKIGNKETGGRVSAPTWLYFMSEFMAYQDQKKYNRLVLEAKQEAEELGIEYQEPEPLKPLDFSVPDGVDPYWVNKKSGRLCEASDPGALLEYFLKGTEPGAGGASETEVNYWDSPDL